MQNDLQYKMNDYISTNSKKSRWKKVVMILSCIVVFCTTYALILPAITMTKEPICGLEEHVHDESCYSQPTEGGTLNCSFAVHQHTDECKIAGELVCQNADFVLHTHDENCFDESGSLICALAECEPHEHTDSCYEEQTVYICALDETEGHQHDKSCFDESGELICTLDECEGHSHSEGCVKIEKKLVCQKKEAVFHEHGEQCYTDGKLTCKKTQLLSHQHTADCFAPSAAEKVLVCEKVEHQHDEVLCYPDDSEESEYTCGYGEHSHVETCYDKNGKLVCNIPEHSHEESCRADFVWEKTKLTEKLGDGVKLTVEGRFDPESVFEAKPLASEKLKKLRASLDTAYLLDFAYELTLTKDGEPVTAKDGFTVTLSGVNLGSNPSWVKGKAYSFSTENLSAATAIGDVSATESSLSVDTDEFTSLYFAVEVKADDDEQLGGESVRDITAWLKLVNSDYFDYWQNVIDEQNKKSAESTSTATKNKKSLRTSNSDGAHIGSAPSQVQVVREGGENTSEDGVVTVGKTIEGTELENVFDITLSVSTKEELKTFYQDPDTAIVIVMDISNTMTYSFGKNGNDGSTTRYQAAMEAAENFIDKFSQESDNISRLGYVAFNTSAHKIFDLQVCSDTSTATSLKNTMRTQTGNIVNSSNYDSARTRFTNIQAGLKMGYDMLSGCKNKYKYIIFLSDGFPTTYIKSGYDGYDPYCTSGTKGADGVFYDYVQKKYCWYGTSYSDKAAIRAREMATTIKNAGMRIFSIGIDIGGQTIQTYSNQTTSSSFSVVDRTSTTYEIGSASSSSAYKNWLKDGIGSGYYYDSTNQSGLESAYEQIFEEMRRIREEEMASLWVTVDPMPAQIDNEEVVEFIDFYDKDGNLVNTSLSGTSVEGGENTASYTGEKLEINWDLKQSGFTRIVEDEKITYSYKLVYRVRLGNERVNFSEGGVYNTNDTTYLKYQTIVDNNGVKNFSDVKQVEFPIPAVKGYLVDFEFRKLDSDRKPLPSAVFTLSHDLENCNVCHGDETSTPIEDITASPDASTGTVSFKNVPSGHIYTLKETTIPQGYLESGDSYSVKVAYDVLTITVTHPNGSKEVWNLDGADVVTNLKIVSLPKTGGNELALYIMGFAMILLSLCLCIKRYGLRRKKERRYG